jgi:TRAP-type uncharacterized transport system fused permease subunit
MGSTIAGGSYFRTAIEGMKVAATAFIIPWLILWNPNIIGHFGGLWIGIGSVFSTVVSIFILQAGLFGQFFTRLNILERAAFIMGSALLIAFVVTQNGVFFFIGLALFLAMLFEQFIRARAHRARQLTEQLA